MDQGVRDQGSHDAVVAAEEIAREYGHHQGRTWFAGARADVAREVLTVYRIPSPGFDSEIQALLGPQVPVEFVDARHSRADLLVAREVVWGLGDDLGVESVSVPVDGSQLDVVVGGNVDDAQAELDRAVPHLVTVRRGSGVTA